MSRARSGGLARGQGRAGLGVLRAPRGLGGCSAHAADRHTCSSLEEWTDRRAPSSPLSSPPASEDLSDDKVWVAIAPDALSADKDIAPDDFQMMKLTDFDEQFGAICVDGQVGGGWERAGCAAPAWLGSCCLLALLCRPAPSLCDLHSSLCQLDSWLIPCPPCIPITPPPARPGAHRLPPEAGAA